MSLDARVIRRLILEQSKRAHVGHIGSALAIADIIATVYGDVLEPGSDRFVLSKGHAALALYIALHLTGALSENDLDTYCADATTLGVHPEAHLPGVEFSTGSLGHGLSIGAGCALAGRMRHTDDRVFVLMSDAECNEGSSWEAVMFAAHHRLANLIAIVDCDRQQALGFTRDVLDLSPLAPRWRAFGWDAHEVNGHDTGAMKRAFDSFATGEGAPHVLIANTTFGKGVSFMESQIRWHYLPMSDAEFAAAMAEVDAAQ